VELLSGDVWIMVFATSKGKTADQNWITSECKAVNDFLKHIKQIFFSKDMQGFRDTYSYTTKATSHNSNPHVN
jgi:hypothetical protein